MENNVESNGWQQAKMLVMTKITEMSEAYSKCHEARLANEADVKTEIAILKLKVAAYGAITGLITGVIGSIIATIIMTR